MLPTPAGKARQWIEDAVKAAPVPQSLLTWAEGLLKGKLSKGEKLDKVHLVDAGCICFTSHKNERKLARTAHIRPSTKRGHAEVYEIEDGWHIPERGRP